MTKDLTMPKYCRRVLLFDTETSGLLPKHNAGQTFPPDSAYPYITQISWVMYNVQTGEIEEVVNEYIRIPDSAELSPDAIRVSGITREILVEKGVPLAPILARFYSAYMKCDSIVAHNLNFDKEIVRHEMRRNRGELMTIVKNRSRVNTMLGIGTVKFNKVYDIELFCTMANTIELCGIEFLPKSSPTSTRKKWPTLSELYSKLFETPLPTDLHNSMIDVLVCLRCFLKVRGAPELTEDRFQTLVAQYSRPSSDI